MKVCPRCGYVEYEHWRQNRWRTNVEFMPLSEFEELYPELAEALKSGKPVVTDRFYTYRLSGRKQKVVERIYIEEYKAGGLKSFHIPDKDTIP